MPKDIHKFQVLAICNIVCVIHSLCQSLPPNIHSILFLTLRCPLAFYNHPQRYFFLTIDYSLHSVLSESSSLSLGSIKDPSISRFSTMRQKGKRQDNSEKPNTEPDRKILVAVDL